jgi:CheY-like chemotaxis protein
VFDLLQLVRSLGRSDRVPIFCVQVSELGAGFQRFCQLIAAELGVDGPAVRLPAQAEGPKTVDARATDAQFHHQCILIIDHDVDAAQSLGMILERIGHEVDFAYDGIAGLDAARRLRPDVVFLDPALPRSDGYELARRLRREPHLRNILIVALSDAGHEKERQRTRDAGFDHHLDKPVDPQFIKQLLVQRR